MRKNGEILKAAEAADMKLINRYTRREMTEDEVYTFSVVLCDNEVDRDFERFTVDALYRLKELFLGKTGVFDHDPKAGNQTARIYSLKVEKEPGKTTCMGEDYCRLVAKAYIPRGAKTEDIILMLDSGIQKEVSVGCAVAKSVCSICGEKSGMCSHIKGKKYSGKICCHELSEPYDAYEWSFVAVPAQRNAGVIKSFLQNGVENMKEIIKSLESGEVRLSAEQSAGLAEYIRKIERDAEDGRRYKSDLQREVKRMAVICEPEIPGEALESVIEKMGIEELCVYKGAYERRLANKRPVKPQLAGEIEEPVKADNNIFII